MARTTDTRWEDQRIVTGRRLTAALEERGMTVEATAALLQMTPSQLRRRLRGEVDIKADEMKALIESMEMDAVEAHFVFFPSYHEELQRKKEFSRITDSCLAAVAVAINDRDTQADKWERYGRAAALADVWAQYGRAAALAAILAEEHDYHQAEQELAQLKARMDAAFPPMKPAIA